jgi:hypothetical protein
MFDELKTFGRIQHGRSETDLGARAVKTSAFVADCARRIVQVVMERQEENRNENKYNDGSLTDSISCVRTASVHEICVILLLSQCQTMT